MKIVAFLPIKLNSQRVPHKNTRILGSHPMCWHLINTLLHVDSIDDVYVYCSSDEVKKYIPEEAIFIKRDKYFDGDDVKSFELISDFISKVESDIYVFANTTSPFLKTGSVENAIQKVMIDKYDSALTVKREQTFVRYKGQPINYDINDIPKTQDMEPVYIETSGFYIFKKEIFTIHHRRVGFKPYLQVVDMIEGIDIDTEQDFEFAEIVLKYMEDKII